MIYLLFSSLLFSSLLFSSLLFSSLLFSSLLFSSLLFSSLLFSSLLFTFLLFCFLFFSLFSLCRTANVLCTAANIKPGDRVMVMLPTITEYWLMQAACLRTGILLNFCYGNQRYVLTAKVLSVRLYYLFSQKGIGGTINSMTKNDSFFCEGMRDRRNQT